MAGVESTYSHLGTYLALSRENQAPGVVEPEIRGNVNFEIKSQFMRELKEDTLSENKDVDTHDYIDRVLSIIGLFNIPGVSKDEGPIPEMRPTQALIAIQTMADHSQKWHDGKTSRKTRSSSSNDGLDCPLNEEVKQVEEVRYGEFGRTAPFDGNNGGKFHVGPPGYYTKIDNRPPYGEKRQSLEELLAQQTPWSVLYIGGLKYTPEVLLAPTAILKRSIFEHLHLTNLKKTNMLCEMADMSKKAPLGIVENVLVKIDKFLFPSDFVIIDNTPSKTTILGRPFLATIHAELDVFAGTYLGNYIMELRISYDTMREKIHIL
ncbi:zinc knuckle CX2CX4HX4C containing protein [Tanacetum coccineum]